MPRKRKEPKDIKLAQPDRSGPTDKTLLQWASERELFAQAELREREAGHVRKSGKRGGDKTGEYKDADEERGGDTEDDDEEDQEGVFTPGQERVLEAALWGATLSTVHAMLDVLVQNQYAVEIELDRVAVRTGQAFLVFLLLLYTLHPHPTTRIPLLPTSYQAPFLQLLFFITSTAAGCYLVHVTNTSGHLAVMKRAPTVACLWLWAVVELELGLSVLSVVVVGGFLWFGGYDFK